MKRLVAIPTAGKWPEMLALTLEKLAAAKANRESVALTQPTTDVHIYVDSVDNQTLGELETVRDLYFPEAFLFHANPHVKAESGSWNILNCLKDAARYADEVYLVEDDVWVYPDFFEGREAGDINCGRRMLRYPNYPYYTNPGSRFNRKALDAIIPHVNSDYYRDTVKYCERFKTQFISCLDDGLIRRVIADNGLSVVTSERKCAHSGVPLMGQLDIYQVNGTSFSQRLVEVRKILTTPQSPARYAPMWEPYQE